MNIAPAWQKGYTGKGVVVSILDDGIQTNHPDLAQNYVRNLQTYNIYLLLYLKYIFHRIPTLHLILTATIRTQRHRTMVITNMAPDVLAKWPLLPLTTTVEWVWHIMPALEVITSDYDMIYNMITLLLLLLLLDRRSYAGRQGE